LETAADPIFSDDYQSMTVDEVEKIDTDALAAFDILVGREIIAEQMFGMIKRYQHPTTRLIDRKKMKLDLLAMKLDTQR